MGFYIKKGLAFFFNLSGINDLFLYRLNHKYQNRYIRIINYHDTNLYYRKNFEKQLKWYKKHFSNVNYQQFESFLVTKEFEKHTKIEKHRINTKYHIGIKHKKNEKYRINTKPGIMLTFDDGLAGNFETARKLLKKYGFTGYFMCSSDLVGTKGYMTYQQLKILINEGHVIADHTATHHRMNEDDTKETLIHEIIDSKKTLEEHTGAEIKIFCWCGGEEQHYTKAAYDLIKQAGYKYGFMTNAKPVVKGDNPFHIQRINVEASWPLYLAKFQVCGVMDKRFDAKRKRVDARMTGSERTRT